MSPSYKYCPYLFRESFGSSASLKSRSKPRDLRELKKMEWEDLIARSSRSTSMRRSVGFSGEKELQRNGRRKRRIEARKSRVFPIFARVLEFPCLMVVMMRERRVRAAQ